MQIFKHLAKTGILVLFASFLFIETASAQDRHKIDSLLGQLKSAKHDTAKIKPLLEIGDAYKNAIPDTALCYYNMALSVAAKASSNKYIASCLKYIGIVLREQGAYDKAIECYMKSLKISEELRDKKGMAQCYNNIGNIHFEQGAYKKAIECYMKSLKIFEKLGNKKGISSCYNNIGNIYFEQGTYDKTIEYYMKSLKIDEELGNKKGISICYNNIGIIYFKLGASASNKKLAADKYDKALECFLKSLKIDEELGDNKGMSTCYNNIGKIYFKQGTCAFSKELATDKYGKALSFFLQSLKIRKKIGDKNGMSGVLVNISDLNNKLKKYNEAIQYANKALDIAKVIGALPLQNIAYENLATAYDSLKNYKKAYQYYKLFKKINDSIFNKESSKQIADMQTKYETKKKEQDLLVKEKEVEVLKRDNQLIEIKRFALYTTLILVIIISLLIVLWLRYKIKVNKKISDAEKKLIQTRFKDSENEKKVLILQLENKKLELEYKNKELEYKNQELVNFALHIVEKNDFLEKLKIMLLNSKALKPKELIQTIDYNLMSLEKERKEFEANIEQVSQTFFMKLREKIPDITKNEERLSALLRLNLSSKEIAMIFNISPQSVEIYRHKLRKKLNLNKEENLHDFLNNI